MRLSRRIGFERFDADICIGKNLADAIEFAMALGPAREIIRLAGEECEKRKHEVVAALRETLAPYSRDDGVWAPSSKSRHSIAFDSSSDE